MGCCSSKSVVTVGGQRPPVAAGSAFPAAHAVKTGHAQEGLDTEVSRPREGCESVHSQHKDHPQSLDSPCKASNSPAEAVGDPSPTPGEHPELHGGKEAPLSKPHSTLPSRIPRHRSMVQLPPSVLAASPHKEAVVSCEPPTMHVEEASPPIDRRQSMPSVSASRIPRLQSVEESSPPSSVGLRPGHRSSTRQAKLQRHKSMIPVPSRPMGGDAPARRVKLAAVATAAAACPTERTGNMEAEKNCATEEVCPGSLRAKTPTLSQLEERLCEIEEQQQAMTPRSQPPQRSQSHIPRMSGVLRQRRSTAGDNCRNGAGNNAPPCDRVVAGNEGQEEVHESLLPTCHQNLRPQVEPPINHGEIHLRLSPRGAISRISSLPSTTAYPPSVKAPAQISDQGEDDSVRRSLALAKELLRSVEQEHQGAAEGLEDHLEGRETDSQGLVDAEDDDDEDMFFDIRSSSGSSETLQSSSSSPLASGAPEHDHTEGHEVASGEGRPPLLHRESSDGPSWEHILSAGSYPSGDNSGQEIMTPFVEPLCMDPDSLLVVVPPLVLLAPPEDGLEQEEITKPPTLADGSPSAEHQGEEASSVESCRGEIILDCVPESTTSGSPTAPLEEGVIDGRVSPPPQAVNEGEGGLVGELRVQVKENVEENGHATAAVNPSRQQASCSSDSIEGPVDGNAPAADGAQSQEIATAGDNEKLSGRRKARVSLRKRISRQSHPQASPLVMLSSGSSHPPLPTTSSSSATSSTPVPASLEGDSQFPAKQLSAHRPRRRSSLHVTPSSTTSSTAPKINVPTPAVGSHMSKNVEAQRAASRIPVRAAAPSSLTQ